MDINMLSNIQQQNSTIRQLNMTTIQGWVHGIAAVLKFVIIGIVKILAFIITILVKVFMGLINSVVMQYIIFIVFLIFLYCMLTGTPFTLFSGGGQSSGGGLFANMMPSFLRSIFYPAHQGPPGSNRSFLNLFFPSLNFAPMGALQRAKANFSQSIDSMRKRMSGYDNTKSTTSIARPTIDGRCDDRDWYNVGNQCIFTKTPQNIQWKIPQSTSQEWSWLPSNLQQRISNNGKRNKVTIPWDVKGSFYVPNCKGAVFADGSSASHLFKDNGLTCDPIVKMSRRHTIMMRKRKGPKDALIPIREEDCSNNDDDDD